MKNKNFFNNLTIIVLGTILILVNRYNTTYAYSSCKMVSEQDKFKIKKHKIGKWQDLAKTY